MTPTPMVVFLQPVFQRVVLLCFLLLAISVNKNTWAQSERPDGSRFTPIVLTEGPTMEEPMAFEVLDDGRVFIIERTGALKLFNPSDKSVKTIAEIQVNTKYTNAEGKVREAEEGLVGLTVHPDFDAKPWVYLLYAHPDEPKHVFARWDFKDDALVESTKKVVLEFPVQRQECCHTGGGMAWDKDQNLFITIGNNTGNNLSSHTDERPGREVWDDQRGAANTNDLRGKNLRIHPEDDGTYSIPAGNLFPPGTPNTRPEIYTMGHRNTWRISVDNHTGYIYWGEVGPDAVSDTEIGPRGYDELNQAKGPGFFGWPYFIGENIAYPYYDYALDMAMAKKDPMKPINNSINNTGLKELPPAQPAFISYPYGVSERFPLVGSGGRSATGGPIYRQSDFDNPERPFPAYYEGKWFAADLSRGWIMVIEMDEQGDYKSMERLVPAYNPAEIIDMKFGPEGDLYVLEYGSRWFQDSEDDKLVRIEYNAGNRTPLVAASASTSGGRIPLEVVLSAEGSVDYDGDALEYEWAVKHETSKELKVYEGAETTIELDKKGRYTAELKVKDPAGASNTKTLTLIAGNEPPEVRLNLAGNNSFFFPDTPIAYDVTVEDAEDGNLATGEIDASQIAISIDYISEGFDYAEVMQGQRSVDASTRYAVAQALMAQSDCSGCHQPDVRSAGPAYTEIAEKYQSGADVTEKLAVKIRNGGSGVWGEINMPAHPAITENDARTIVDYLLHFNDQTLATLPASGSYDLSLPDGDTGRGSLVVRAAYTDRGAEDVSPLSSEEVIILRSASVDPGSADVIEGAETTQSRGRGPIRINAKAGGHIGFHAIDLTGLSTMQLSAVASPRAGAVGGTIEVRKGSTDGELLGIAEIKVSANRGWRQRAEPVSIDLSGEAGMHDLFFLFKNEEARPIDPLFLFSNISFVQETE